MTRVGVARVVTTTSFACALLVTWAARSAAQDSTTTRRKVDIDHVEIASVGVAAGWIRPAQLVPTRLIALQADYGNVLPVLRVVFGASYWESRFRPQVIQQFADSLQQSLTDTSARVEPSPVRMFDATFNVEGRFMPRSSAWITPFAGVGLAAHVLNAEGKLIKGTFVERSLDAIAAGMYATAGLTVNVGPHVALEGIVRGDLVSSFRSTQARVGASYLLGHTRGASGDVAPSQTKR